MNNQKLKNVYLIGPMGAGKSTVGKILAHLMQVDFYESDREIEMSTGVDIPWIFEQEGEDGFRQREIDAIKRLTKLHSIVLSTGGGVVVKAVNRQLLAGYGIVVYLQVSIDRQLQRTERSRHTRPLLLQKNVREQVTRLNEAREPLYSEIADIAYDTDGLTPKQIADMIFQDIKRLQSNDSTT